MIAYLDEDISLNQLLAFCFVMACMFSEINEFLAVLTIVISIANFSQAIKGFVLVFLSESA